MPADRSLLFSFAHPDDESFLVAGVACKYGPAGARVALVTATLGEAGKAGDPPLATREALPAARKEELRRAAGLLGIAHLELLGHRDRELASAPPDRIREQLVRAIRRHRPHIVITFDPNGGNLHPDHVAISRFTCDAVAAAADDRWFPDAGPAHHVARLLWTPRLPLWDLIALDNLAGQASVDFMIDIRAWRDRKVEALRAHRTQHLSIDRIFFDRPDVDRLLEYEIFRQAWGPPLHRRPENDLFAGIA